MHDVEQALLTDNQHLPTIHSVNTPLFDLAYADDTILVGRNHSTVQKALHHVQHIAKLYNLKLNTAKCIHMKMHSTHSIHFADNSTVPHHHRAKYLGVILRDDCSTLTDINARIGKVRSGFKKLQQFWRHTNITQHFKLRIYKATFIPMLTYGMESATLTQPHANKLNAFHTQRLRKILGRKSTYYTEVLDPTQPTVNNQAIHDQTSIPPLTAIIATQQLKLLGHILREPTSELTRNVSFTKSFVYRGRGGKQREEEGFTG